jgi:RHS repeat-associated protein
VSYTPAGLAATTYVYDGEGRRVQKIEQSGPTSTYVYDAMGQLAAEYDTGSSTASDTQYLTADYLGSTRMLTDANGNPVACHDYQPFGAEIPAGINGRGTCYAGTDNPKQKFTGKERDEETGLDYFGARYFSSAQGRFVASDTMLAKKEWLPDPQRWNRYAYVRNNPFRYVDPNGEDLVIYYGLGRHVSDRDRKWFEDHKDEILAAIREKFEKAGVKNVSLRDMSTLSDDQIRSLETNTPFGVGRLEFAGAAGATDRPGETFQQRRLSKVYLDNLQPFPDKTCDWICTEGVIGAHEIGHGQGLNHVTLKQQGYSWWQRAMAQVLGGGVDHPDVMTPGEEVGYPSQPWYFNMHIEQNRRVVEELNKIGDMTPKSD